MKNDTQPDLSDFDLRLLRLKEALGVTKDVDVANALGLSRAALFDRKRRGAFPDDKLWALIGRRPDLGIDWDYITSGSTMPARKSAGGRRGVSGRIRTVRMGTGLGHKEFGARVGVSRNTQFRYENGDGIPDLCYLERLASEYGIDKVWLMTGYQLPEEACAAQAGELTDEMRTAITEVQKLQIEEARLFTPEKFVSLVSRLARSITRKLVDEARNNSPHDVAAELHDDDTFRKID